MLHTPLRCPSRSAISAGLLVLLTFAACDPTTVETPQGGSSAVAPPQTASSPASADAEVSPPGPPLGTANASPALGESTATGEPASTDSPGVPDAGTLADAAMPDAGMLDAGAGKPTEVDARVDSETEPVDDSSDAGENPQEFPFPPFEATGSPLSAPDRTWTYVEFPETRCRDGSPAGISLNLNGSSKKLLIYLEGAAYCFDGVTCLMNADTVEDGIFNAAKDGPKAGIFDLEDARNPVRDWNIVYVPNCSGDGHGGTQTTPMDVPGGPRGQLFAGHLNLQAYLQRVVPTFPDVSDVLLAGISSGGFGVLQNLVLVQRAFPGLQVRYVHDSNPPLSSTVVAECLQDRMRSVWGLDRGSLAYCGDSCPDPRDYLEDNALFLATLLSDRPGGYIEAVEDSLMLMVFGLGNDDCTGTLLLDSVPKDTFRAALLGYRDAVEPLPNYGTFYPDATQHTWLGNEGFYTVTAGGVSLVDWFARIANDQPPGHAGP